MPYIDKINYKGTEYDLQDTALKEDLQEETEARENLGSTLASLGLVVVNGQLCAKYAE